jgi:transposase
LSSIIFITRIALRWCYAPRKYGPPKTLYDRWNRWGDKIIFARMIEGLASEAAVPKTVMIDATSLQAHRTATSRKRWANDQCGHLIGRTEVQQSRFG